MRKLSFLSAAALAAALSVPLYADEVMFKNGDQISGKIESMEGGKMIIATKFAGKVTVDMKDVKTFSSDEPIKLKLIDGNVIDQKIDAGPDGQVAVAAGGKLQAQAVALSDVKSVNFKEDWTGNITAGGAIARGNTESETLSLAIHMERKTDNDKIIADAGYLYGRQRFTINNANGTTSTSVSETQDDWFIGAQYDYNFTKEIYAYVNGKVERDTIAGISLRVTPGGGVGYNCVDRPDFHVHEEAGISWLYRDYTHGGGTDETVAARLAYHIDKKIADKVVVFHDFEYFPGLDTINDYYFDTDAGIRTALTDKMFAEFKIQEQYDSMPAPTKGHNDTQFILNVGWNF